MSAPVVPPSLPPTPAITGPAVASPVVVVLDGAAEALAALAAAAQIAGTVAPGENPGELVLLTALGALSLKTPPALPAGTRLVIQAMPGRPDAAIVLAIDDVATAARPVPAPATGAAPAPLPPTVLELGTTVTATLLAGADDPPAASSAVASPPEAAAAPAAPGTARPATAVAVGATTIPPSPATSAKTDLAGIVAASDEPASKTTVAASFRAPATAAAPPTLSGSAIARAPGTAVTLRILAVQPTTETGSPAVPALRGIVQPSPQRQAGMLIDTPAGVLRVFAASEPEAGRPAPPTLPPGTPVALRLLAGAPPTALLTVPAPDAPAKPIARAAQPAEEQSAAAPEPPAAPARPASVSYRVLFGDSGRPQPAGRQSPVPQTSAKAPILQNGEAPATPRLVIGTVLADHPAAGATLIATPFGTLAVNEKLALPPGTLLLLALRDDPPVADAALPASPPRFDQSWSALEATLATLEHAAPELAAHLRADLSPQSGERLAAGLMVLVAALRDGTTRNWAGDAVAHALGAAGRDDLTLRLGDDLAALRGIADNKATNPWQVFLLPLVDGPIIRPIRLYLKRRGERRRRDTSDDNARFILEFELTRLGTMQLDGFVRPRRFDLVLRSRAALAAPLRGAVERIFHDRVAAAGLAGTIGFATAARFDVAPLDRLRARIGLAV